MIILISFAGTSTGGILTALYLIKDQIQDQYSKFSAKEILKIFKEKGHRTFAPPISEKLASRKKLVEDKYSSGPLENCLKELLGENAGIGRLAKPAVITAYDIINREAVLFKSWLAKQDPKKDYKAWEVCRATSAAPGFFEPAIVEGYNHNAPLIDGSVFAGNPAMCAFTEASNLAFSRLSNCTFNKDFPSKQDMLLVSISTGTSKKIGDPMTMNGKGLSWIRPIIDILLSSNMEVTDHQLRNLLTNESANLAPNYYRLEPELKSADEAIDNIETSNLDELYQTGVRYIQKNEDLLDQIARQVLEQELRQF